MKVNRIRRNFSENVVSLLAALLMFGAAHGAYSQQSPLEMAKINLGQKTAQGTTVFRHALLRHGGDAKPVPDAKLSGHAPVSRSFKGAATNLNSIAYPGDVSYQGGATVYSAVSHPVYMLPNGVCPIATCWGAPENFLSDYTNSPFSTVVNQYVGASGTGRYTLGRRWMAPYTPPTTPLTDADMQTIVHVLGSLSGATGYGHIYHIFLPPGQDECFDSTYSQCYSPDNSGSFAFCAYHSSVDFNDIGHVLYTVEPYQNVAGCAVEPGTPNGQLVDSTNDVLSHELNETITDPDGDAWWNTQSGALYGNEVGDECFFLTFNYYPNVFSVPFVYPMNNNLYATQPEYSNQVHGCTVRGF